MIYTASFIGLLRVLLYMIVFYYLWKVVMRLLGPFIRDYIISKVFTQNNTTKKNYREGETVVDRTQSKNKKSKSDNLGEYIDYEEID